MCISQFSDQDIVAVCWHRGTRIVVECWRGVFHFERRNHVLHIVDNFLCFTSWYLKQNSENIMFPRCYFLQNQNDGSKNSSTVVCDTLAIYMLCYKPQEHVSTHCKFNWTLFSCLQCQAVLTNWGQAIANKLSFNLCVYLKIFLSIKKNRQQLLSRP